MKGDSLNQKAVLRKIEELCCDYALDRHQQPLFADVKPGYYISRRYDKKDTQVLKGYGLWHWHWTIIMGLVKCDLAQHRLSGEILAHRK